MPGKKEMPSTIARSPQKAQETWVKTHDSAVEEYGEGERAHRTAFSSLKHSFEKEGDHWKPKDEKGPSDPRAERGGSDARQGKGADYGGVDYNGHSKDELMDRARQMEISGRSKMSKEELAEAIDKANKRETAKAR